MQIKYDELDAKIYRAMIELGWIIATTEEEVEWFDEANKDFEPPPFDFDKSLEEIKRRIKMQEEITEKELDELEDKAYADNKKFKDELDRVDKLGEEDEPEKFGDEENE